MADQLRGNCHTDSSKIVVTLISAYLVAMQSPCISFKRHRFPSYAIMRLGKVKLLPVYLPGDPAMGEAVRGLAGKRTAVLLANHGPVVAGLSLEAAAYAIEEFEETARLALLTRGLSPRLLSDEPIAAVVEQYGVEWE